MPASVKISVGGKSAFYRANWIKKDPPQFNNELLSELRALPGMDWVRPNHGEPRLEISSDSGELEPILDCFQIYGYSLTRGR